MIITDSSQSRRWIWVLLLLLTIVSIALSIVMVAFFVFGQKHDPCFNQPPTFYWLSQDARQLVPDLTHNLDWDHNETVLEFSSSNYDSGKTGFMLILPEVDKVQGHLYSLQWQSSTMNHSINSTLTQSPFLHPRVTYGKTDSLLMDTIPWPNLTFHKIVSIYQFHLIHDLSPVLVNFKKLLKPDGGQLAFTTLTMHAWEIAMLWELSQIDQWKPYLSDYLSRYHPKWSQFLTNIHAERGMRAIFLRAGYYIDYVRADTMTLFYPDFDTYLEERLSMLQPALAAIPYDLYPQLKNDAKGLFPKLTEIPVDAKNFNISYNYIIGIVSTP